MTSSNSNWKLEGDYFEGCNCDVTCPCIFKGDPDEDNCNLTTAWHIQNGSYGNINVNELNVVGLFHTPGNMLTGPKWKAALYIDERATKEQSDSLIKIFSGQAGGFFAGLATTFIGEVLGVKSAPIEFGIDGKRRWLHIKDSMELEIEGVIGGDENQESRIVNPAFGVVPGSDLVVARSTKYRYDDHGMKWDNSGKNGFYCKFRYSS
ncbi:MAG TPA: DUF1326 domain-containing protein [Nitrososphaeraceae archaeon]|nr:DUF1326 domain-containing protein [Nitrososphaeraceae archaeon]